MAGELTESRIIKFGSPLNLKIFGNKIQKKFAAVMPESLAKYRSTDAKIKDNFLNSE